MRQDSAPFDRSLRLALALHEVPGGADHIDLFIGPPASADPDARTVRTWRLPTTAWQSEGLACGRFVAMELELHRAEYLDLATTRTLSDGRGRVRPLIRGAASGDGRAVLALGHRFDFIAPDLVEISRVAVHP